MSFDLEGLVHRVIDDTDIVNPGEIAAKVLDSIPTEHLRDVLQMTLRQYVLTVVSRDRFRTAHPPKVLAGTANPSTKVLAIREYGKAWLRTRECIGGEWKLLGNCTYNDLMVLADTRKKAAERYLAKAEKYRRLAKELVRANASTPLELEQRGVDLTWWEDQ